MSVRNQLKLLVGGLNARRAGHSASPHSATREFFDRSRLVAVLIFVATVTAIVLISSAGLTTLNVPSSPTSSPRRASPPPPPSPIKASSRPAPPATS